MSRTIRARVKQGLLEPLEAIDVPDGAEVTVTIVDVPSAEDFEAFGRAAGSRICEQRDHAPLQPRPGNEETSAFGWLSVVYPHDNKDRIRRAPGAIMSRWQCRLRQPRWMPLSVNLNCSEHDSEEGIRRPDETSDIEHTIAQQ